MYITEADKKLMSEIQRNLRKGDHTLSNYLSDDLSNGELLLFLELQLMVRRLDSLLNYFSDMISNQQKNDIIAHAVEYNMESVTIPVPAHVTDPVLAPVTAPVTKTNSKLSLIFSKSTSLEETITNLLLEIGIPAHIKGYLYIRTSLILLIEKILDRAYITKLVYPEVAKHYKTTSDCVERCIRHAIEVAWNEGNPEILNELFAYSISSEKGKPSNSQFLFRIADYIKLHM